MKAISCVLIAALAVSTACSDRAEDPPAVPAAKGTPPDSARPSEVGRPSGSTAGSAPTPASATEAKDARAAASGPVTQAAAQAGVNPDAAILDDFKTRVNKYVDLHKDAAKGAAKLKETKEPAEITNAQATLAERIRAARPNAAQGDIFTAEIRHKIRRMLAPELKGQSGRDAKEAMKDDAPPPGSIAFKVNAKYPEGQPRPTMPANLLVNLPTLPKPLEYRIVGKHLILLDGDADLIVDYIPNAIR